MTAQDTETYASLTDLLGKVTEIYDYLEKAVELNTIFANSIEALEKQFAAISVGYVEQAVMLEGLVELIPDDKLESFAKHVQKKRSKIFKAIEDGQDALSGVIEDLNSTMEQSTQAD